MTGTKQLSREEKLALVVLLEEKQRREKQKRPVFKDRASAEQLEILACDATERFVFAGNGFGKTALGSEDVRAAITGSNPYNGKRDEPGTRAYIILDKPEKIEAVILPELRKWMNISSEQCHKRGKPYVAEIVFPEYNNAWIRFLFWDQNPMTAEGIEGDYFWFDEPPPRALYIALRRGGRTKGRRARYLVTGTPLAAPWLRTEIYEPWSKGLRADCECFRGHTESNRHNLADGYIESFSAALSEKERGIRLRGEFFDLDGLALSHLFRRETHVVKSDAFTWDQRQPCVIAIDPHTSKPHHAVVLGVDRENRLYVLEEYKEKAVARRFAKALVGLNWFSKYRIVDIVYDSAGNAETTSGEGFKPFAVVFNEVMQAHGLGRARATTYEDKSDEDFINRLQDALLLPEPDSAGLRVPKLRFLDRCRGTISDVENVQWKRDKQLDQNKATLEISNTDFLSCVKYALACNLYANKGKDKVYYQRRQPYGVDLGAPRRNAFRARVR